MARRLLVAVLALGLLVVVRSWLGARIARNDSPSMQQGYYWLVPGASVRRGDVVLACPPARFTRWAQSAGILGPGPCNGGESVIKRVVAVAGDRVRIDARGVSVDGRYLPGSRPALFHGVAVPHVAFGERTLGPGEVQLAGDRRSQSWDGRYFGPTSVVLRRALLMLGTGG